MKKPYQIISLLIVLALAFGAVSPAFAQGGDHPQRGEGPLSEYIADAFAAALGLDPSDVQSRLDAGESLKMIAADLGYEVDLSAIFGDAISAAVSAGAISQEQAERMANRERSGEKLGGRGAGIFEKLSLSKEEVQALLDSGMTMQEIFAQQGVANRPENGSRGGNFGQRDGNKISESCGISSEEIHSRINAGESLEEICPGMSFPDREGRPIRAQ